MHARFLVIGLLLTTALAGCLESGDEAPAQDLPEQTQSLDANATNLPPVASVAATVVNGTAPLNVTFTLEASDADGDNLTWSFDDGAGNTTEGNASALPATVNATYLAGNWSAVFTVTDGTNETVETVAVEVSEAAEDADETVGNATEDAAPAAPFFQDNLLWDVGATQYPSFGTWLTCTSTPLHTFDHYFLELDAGAGGREFTATITDVAGGADIQTWGFWAIDSACLTDEYFEFTGGEASGTLPEDTGYILTYAYGGFLLDMDLTIQ